MHVTGNQKQEWERAPSLDSIKSETCTRHAATRVEKRSCVCIYVAHVEPRGIWTGDTVCRADPFALFGDNDMFLLI